MTFLQKKPFDTMRPMHMIYDFVTAVPGSVLIVLGNTKVLCTIALQKGVPPFLRNSGTGWLTAEYSMLPNATQQRTTRDSNSAQRNGRSIEISRLIGRAMRTVVDVSGLGERTIYIDCDVLQADGGTRATAITGASVALELAQNAWLAEGLIKKSFLKERVAAVSVGLVEDTFILDPDYAQDSMLNADFNIIMTASGKLIELHGGAEKNPISWDQLEQLRNLGIKGIAACFSLMERDLGKYKHANNHQNNHKVAENKHENLNGFSGGMFSLANRLKQIDSLKE